MLFSIVLTGAMTEKQKQELAHEGERSAWISDFINAMLTWIENCDKKPFPNRKIKGASFTQFDDGAISVNFLYSKEGKENA